MDDNKTLDTIFKRYLQILRPYLLQLVDQDVIDLCNAWIQKLSNCSQNEKELRNKYVFSLCYQIARGVLDEPFLKYPPVNELLPFSDEIHSDDSSSEVECIVINSQVTNNTKILYDNNKPSLSDTEYLSQDIEDENKNECEKHEDIGNVSNDDAGQEKHNQTCICYTCPKILRKFNHFGDSFGENYEHRANNLITKLREIKKQNLMLKNELVSLREMSRNKSGDKFEDSILKVDNAVYVDIRRNDSYTTLNSLKYKLQEVQDSRNALIERLGNLQDELDNFNELKIQEINEIEAKHKIEIISIKSSIREEIKAVYEKKLEELKCHYENSIKDVQRNSTDTQSCNKDEIIKAKEKEIKTRDAEIDELKVQILEQKRQTNSILHKLLDKSDVDFLTNDLTKTHFLEKRLHKMEKSKIKTARAFEAKITNLQRENHLAECTLQLQLVRQRAQVVNEVTDENQTELSTALDKLENKYKDIIANVQATAIQRTIQDQATLDAILQACGFNETPSTTCPQSVNRSPQLPGRTARNKNKDVNRSFDREVTTVLQGNKTGNVVMGNKSFDDDSVTTGYCLDAEKLGDLFDKVYIPQRDTGEGLKK